MRDLRVERTHMIIIHFVADSAEISALTSPRRGSMSSRNSTDKQKFKTYETSNFRCVKTSSF